ncbi:MAG: NifU family protein [Proteobacteria bacterium]|nr:NifU family protein [Pseudomonadota bacterium]
MFIQIQTTPNPQTLKFIPGVQVLAHGTISIMEGDKIEHISIARDLFKVSGVSGVFMTEDFITITKAPDAPEWHDMKPALLSVMLDHFASGKPIAVVARNELGTPASIEDEIVRQICSIIEEQIAPAVRSDGGDIVFHEFVDGVVYLKLMGSCSGCPSASVTLKNGVENMLRHYVPEVKRVEEA